MNELLKDIQQYVLNYNLILTSQGVIEMDKPTTVFAQGYIENEAMAQFNSAMETEHAIKGALMPDTHTGYSLPIGAVVQTKNYVYPSWVGYDIGCGMCAVRTSYSRKEIELHSKAIFDSIYEEVPVGAAKHRRSAKVSTEGLTKEGVKIFASRSGGRQLCTLGGGNHFIEIGYADDDDAVWIIIHSGSRGVGHGIAGHYMTIASNDPERFEREWEEKHADVMKYRKNWRDIRDNAVTKSLMKAKAKEGHYGFQVDTKNGKDYIQDMHWCLEYAIENRRRMIASVEDAIDLVIGTHDGVEWNTLINRNHNHAEVSKTDNTVIHRKGATHAEKDMLGVIPGNMRDGSFIVRGKGNSASLNSCSHGAGRILSRGKAKSTLEYQDFKDTMVGITAMVDEGHIDESPMAYKNIFDVMEAQKDLVEVLHHVTPLINIKG